MVISLPFLLISKICEELMNTRCCIFTRSADVMYSRYTKEFIVSFVMGIFHLGFYIGLVVVLSLNLNEDYELVFVCLSSIMTLLYFVMILMLFKSEYGCICGCCITIILTPIAVILLTFMSVMALLFPPAYHLMFIAEYWSNCKDIVDRWQDDKELKSEYKKFDKYYNHYIEERDKILSEYMDERYIVDIIRGYLNDLNGIPELAEYSVVGKIYGIRMTLVQKYYERQRKVSNEYLQTLMDKNVRPMANHLPHVKYLSL